MQRRAFETHLIPVLLSHLHTPFSIHQHTQKTQIRITAKWVSFCCYCLCLEHEPMSMCTTAAIRASGAIARPFSASFSKAAVTSRCCCCSPLSWARDSTHTHTQPRLPCTPCTTCLSNTLIVSLPLTLMRLRCRHLLPVCFLPTPPQHHRLC